jgi:hypothetical protein
MAKTFLTNINLKGNQLLNATMHPASSAPTIYNAGQVYFDTTARSNRGALYVSVVTNYPTLPAVYAWKEVNTTDLTVNTINGFTGAVTVAGTSNQITVTSNAGTITLSLPSAITVPGSLNTTTSLTVGNTLSVTAGTTTLAASTTSGASLNIPIGVNPTAPAAGDIWLKSTGLNAYYGGATHTIADLDSTQTLTNKTLDFGPTGNNTAVSIPNSALSNSKITVNSGTGISLNGSTTPLTVNLGDSITIANTGVTSVALSLPSIFAVSGSPVTTTGTLSATLSNQNANFIFAGPSTGSPAAPTFRVLADSDIPASIARLASPTFTGTVTIPTLSLTNALSVSNGGTGATTAAGARTNLGAAESGANSSITSLSGLTTALSVGQGGTGTSTTPTAGKLLIGKSDGTYAVATLAQGATSGVTITNGSGTITLDTAQDIRTSASPSFAQVTVAADPTQALQVATKQYVDNISSGFNSHDAVIAATTTNLAAVYATGTTTLDGGAGAGATLTASANAALVIDNVTLVVGDRVLVKNQTTQTQNGIYVVTTTGSGSTKWVLTRAVDHDNHEAGQVTAGDIAFVYSPPAQYSVAPTQQNTGWVQNGKGTATTPLNAIKVGTDSITFTQFSGSGTVTAGAGLSVTGLQVAVNLGTTSDTSASSDATNPSGLSVNNGTLQVKLNSAGALSTGAYGLKVNTGAGLTISSNNLTFASDTVTQTATGVSGGARAYGIQKVSATITGNGSASSFAVLHNLGTRDVTVAIYQASASPDTQWSEVETDVTHTDTNTVTVGFASAPANGILYNVVITG